MAYKRVTPVQALFNRENKQDEFPDLPSLDEVVRAIGKPTPPEFLDPEA